MKEKPVIKIIFVFLILLVLGNLLLLDWVYFSKREETKEEKTSVSISEEEKISLLNACRDICGEEILRAIATISGKGVIKEVTKEVVTPAAAKEYYIPLGSGEVSSLDWVEITGAEAYIDSSKYGKIKEAYFEAILKMPQGTGTVYAMLFNTTDKHPVWGSEVSSISTTGERVSAKINLDEGNKLYRLKMKLSIPHKGICDLARVKIITY